MKKDAFINGNREIIYNVTSVEFGYGDNVCVIHINDGVRNLKHIQYRAVNRVY